MNEPTYIISYRLSADAEEQVTCLAPSEELGPLHPQTGKRGRYCFHGDWLQSAATAGAIFQQLHAKCPVREGGHLVVSDVDGKPLWAHPRAKAAELGCKNSGNLRVVEPEEYRAKQQRVKAEKSKAKSNAVSGWFKS